MDPAMTRKKLIYEKIICEMLAIDKDDYLFSLCYYNKNTNFVIELLSSSRNPTKIIVEGISKHRTLKYHTLYNS